MNSRRVLFWAALAAACAQANCSFLFLERPPERDQLPYRHADGSVCTERNKLPVTDLVLTGAIPVSVLALMLGPGQGTGAKPQDSGASERKAEIMLGSALVLSGVMLTSAIWGFYTTHECRKYARALDEPAQQP